MIRTSDYPWEVPFILVLPELVFRHLSKWMVLAVRQEICDARRTEAQMFELLCQDNGSSENPEINLPHVQC